MQKNVKLTIEYKGSNYLGWQIQPDGKTVQGELQSAIKSITGEDVNLIGSGRTDAGVHAYGQVANFITDSKIEAIRLPAAINSQLPKDISVKKVEYVDDDFHSRFSAKGKKYRYRIYNSKNRSALDYEYSYHIGYRLDLDLMKDQAEKLIGSHDFTSFVSSGSTSKSNVRTIYSLDLKKEGDYIIIDIEGDGFLYNMVRIITGTLIDIARGRITRSMDEIIERRDRSLAGHTAPAHGLYLYEVYYD